MRFKTTSTGGRIFDGSPLLCVDFFAAMRPSCLRYYCSASPSHGRGPNKQHCADVFDLCLRAGVATFEIVDRSDLGLVDFVLADVQRAGFEIVDRSPRWLCARRRPGWHGVLAVCGEPDGGDRAYHAVFSRAVFAATEGPAFEFPSQKAPPHMLIRIEEVRI